MKKTLDELTWFKSRNCAAALSVQDAEEKISVQDAEEKSIWYSCLQDVMVLAVVVVCEWCEW